jgi:hypothetical protein
LPKISTRATYFRERVVTTHWMGSTPLGKLPKSSQLLDMARNFGLAFYKIRFNDIKPNCIKR